MNSRDIEELHSTIIRSSRVREIKEYFIKKRFEEQEILGISNKYMEFANSYDETI
jgi:hypothetical protein